MTYNATLRVWRGDEAGGELQDFTVEVNEGEVVLDIIHRLQQTQTPDLAVRWNCKAGKCGSCSAEVNGKPRLMCMTRMSTFAEDEVVTVTPIRTFPVIRDLVTDVSFNYEKAREIPSFAPPKDLQPGEYRMAQQDVERSQEFRKCIECFLCNNVCHVIRDHDENKEAFAGPRFLMRIAELEMHPLDTLDRRNQAQEEHGLGYCNITKCCTEVCPESIKITDNALIPMKERVADRKYDPVVWLGSKLFASVTQTPEPPEDAAVEHDRRDLGVDLDIADPQYHDRVIPGRDELLDRGFHPHAGALYEDRATGVGHRFQVGEPIAGLCGQRPRSVVVRLAQQTDAERAHVLELRPRRRGVLHAERHQRRIQGHRDERAGRQPLSDTVDFGRNRDHAGREMAEGLTEGRRRQLLRCVHRASFASTGFS